MITMQALNKLTNDNIIPVDAHNTLNIHSKGYSLGQLIMGQPRTLKFVSMDAAINKLESLGKRHLNTLVWVPVKPYNTTLDYYRGEIVQNDKFYPAEKHTLNLLHTLAAINEDIVKESKNITLANLLTLDVETALKLQSLRD